MSLAAGIRQQSPNFLAPGTGFTEDNFSMDKGAVGGGARVGIIQVPYIYCVLHFYFYDIVIYNEIII